MGNIIFFEPKRKWQESRINKEKSHIAAEKTGSKRSKKDTNYTTGLNAGQKIKLWQKAENEEEERFKESYCHVLAVVPISAVARMKHFAKVMLPLVPDIFCDNGWDTRFDAWMNFCQLYTAGFDPACSRYFKENPNFWEAYQYKFEAMPAEKLEEELEDCLINLLILSPEKNSAHKAEIAYQAARLFELEEIMSTLFYEELTNE